MAQEQESMKDEIVETIMKLCALYLKLGEAGRSGSVIRIVRQDGRVDPISDAIFFREEVWNKLLSVLQKIHRL